MARHTITTEVEVDLDDFTDEELTDEMDARGYDVVKRPKGNKGSNGGWRDEARALLAGGHFEEALLFIGRQVGHPFVDLPAMIHRRFQ